MVSTINEKTNEKYCINCCSNEELIGPYKGRLHTTFEDCDFFVCNKCLNKNIKKDRKVILLFISLLPLYILTAILYFSGAFSESLLQLLFFLFLITFIPYIIHFIIQLYERLQPIIRVIKGDKNIYIYSIANEKGISQKITWRKRNLFFLETVSKEKRGIDVFMKQYINYLEIINKKYENILLKPEVKIAVFKMYKNFNNFIELINNKEIKHEFMEEFLNSIDEVIETINYVIKRDYK